MTNVTECHSFENGSCQMKGNLYNNGFFTNYSGSVTFYIKKKYKSLKFVYGPVDNNPTSNTATVRLFADGNQMDTVINQKYDDKCEQYSIDVSNVDELKFEWSNCGYYSFATANMILYK